ncbi:MAG: tetratricopeptide repeat protein [Vampirovibrionales bacterium]|nr:tetratricopeptide repeat protein [Vampirovibrionales bacterium]
MFREVVMSWNLTGNRSAKAAQARSLSDELTCQAEALIRQSAHPRQGDNLQYRAMDLLAQALEHEPDHARALALLARVNLDRARFDKARSLAFKSLSFEPQQAAAPLTLTRIALFQRNAGEARQWGWQALRFSKTLGDTHMALRLLARAYDVRTPATFLMAFLLWGAAFCAGLAAGIGSMRELPGVWGPLLLAGFQALSARFHHDDDAERVVWQSLHERFPGLNGVQIRLADLCATRGMLDEAQYWYRRVLKRNPLSALACDRLATLFEATDRHEDAIALLEHLLTLAPQRADAYRRLGDLYAALGDLEQASGYYQTFLRSQAHPRDRALQAVNLAHLYHDLLDNPQAAQLAMLSAIAAEPRQTDHYLQLGAYYYEAGQFADAERVYADALRLEPDNLQALACLGYFKWQTGEIDAAVDYYLRAIDRDPSYDIAYNNLGVIYLDHLGRVRDAMALFERAIGLNSGYALAFYNLGRAHRFMGERERAVRCFERARQVNDVTGELDDSQLDTLIHALSQAVEG